MDVLYVVDVIDMSRETFNFYASVNYPSSIGVD